MQSENYTRIRELANNDVDTLVKKGETYGRSWQNRGGAGAFMMLARKWDRIENICKGVDYNIFKACITNTGEVLDDIRDLRAYLLLVESEVETLVEKQAELYAAKNACAEDDEDYSGYVNQD